MAKRSSPFTWVLSHPWYLVIAAVTVLFTWWAVGTRTQDHHVEAQFATAFNLVSGLAVSVDGQEVGKLGKVRYDNGRALVEIGINDERFWPLHEGTKLVSRWGTTIGSGTRRIDLIPGPTSGPPLPEGGAILTSDTLAAVDVDQVLNMLSTRVRVHLRGSMAGMDAGLRGHVGQLNAALHTAAGGVEATGDLMSDLARDRRALRTFVTNTHKLTDTLAARAEGVKGVITVAAQTFDTFARHTRGTQASIDELGPAMRQARTTLARVNTTIHKVDPLVAALAPGVRRLLPLARVARPAMVDARVTLPVALRTVQATTKAAPRITRLLGEATPFAKRSPDVLGALAPMVSCVRPYAPEAAGAIVGGAGWTQVYDLHQTRNVPEAQAFDLPAKYPGPVGAEGRIIVHSLAATPVVAQESFDSQVLSPEQFTKLVGKQYAAVRPPGLSVGQPWFLPECNVTKDGLDPAKDSEYHP